jgi:DNA-directed RNA polymerase specialized sigma24 family protein
MLANSRGPLASTTRNHDAFQRIVMHAFALPSAFRKVYLLCAIRGFTVAKTAVILGISSEAVILRLHRARREMKMRLQTEE